MISKITRLQEKLTSQIDKETHINVKKNLLSIYNILSHCREDSDLMLIKIQEAILFIENIPTVSMSNVFFKKDSLTIKPILKKCGEKLLEDKILPISTNELINPKVVSHNKYRLFGSYHKSLMGKLDNLLSDDDELIYGQEPKWVYKTPVGEKGIFNESIKKWQTTLSEAEGMFRNPLKSYTDFKRDFTINDCVGTDDDNVDSLIDTLIEESNYNDENKLKFKQWIKYTGGQDMNRFVDLLLSGGAFTGRQEVSLLMSSASKQNWSVSDGKLTFSYQVTISSLNDSNQPKTVGEKGEFINIDVEDMEDAKPLLKISAVIELDMVDNQVIPKITEMTTASFSHQLSPLLSTAPMITQEETCRLG